MDFYSAFEALNTADKVAKNLTTIIKNSRGHERAVLREFKENLELLFMVRRHKVPADKVINKLSVDNYLNAANSGFNFKAIKRGSVKEKTTGGIPQLKKYIGWSTERLLENIYLKIKFLQNYLEMAADPQKINIDRRMEYLIRVMLLFLQHIKK